MKPNEVAAEVAATLLGDMYIPTAYRTCAVCRYFSLDLGEPAYSELTPGVRGSISCSHSFGAWGECHPDESDFYRLIGEAKKCQNFALREDT